MPSREMGERFQRLRLAAGLSQSQAAEKAGVPLGTIQGWERGRREPLLSAAVKLALALGVSLDELARGVAQVEAPPVKPKGRPKKS